MLLFLIQCFGQNSKVVKALEEKTGYSTKSYNISSSHWCKIQVLDESFYEKYECFFDFYHQITKNSFFSFLSPSEISAINSTNEAYIYIIPQSEKLKSDISELIKSDTVVVIAHPNFSQSNFQIIKTIKRDIFTVKLHSNSTELNELISSNLVLSIYLPTKISFFNSVAVGYLQGGIHKQFTIKNGFPLLQRPLHDLGYRGEGEVITIVDSGINTESIFFHDSRNISIPYNICSFSHRKIASYISINSDDFNDNSGHGTHVSGIAVGSVSKDNEYSFFNGTAPDAKLIIIDTEDSKGIAKIGIEIIDIVINSMSKCNSYISSNSWGMDKLEGIGQVFRYLLDHTSYEYPEFLFVFSSGNNPSLNYVTGPSNAKNVLTVGALSQLYDYSTHEIIKKPKISKFQGNGPTIYGQIKPEVVAPGEFIFSASKNLDKIIELNFGTSMACPFVSGSLLLIREYLEKKFNIKNISSCLLRALAIASADNPINPQTPDPKWGFGMINITNLIYELSGKNVSFETFDVSKNDEIVYRIDVTNNSDLRIVMSYIDDVLSHESLIPLVHDIDLFVVRPNGNILHPLYNSNEDIHSTNERIFIDQNNIENGIYSLHIRSSKCIKKDCSSKTSLAIVGNFSHLKKVTTKTNWSLLCISKNTYKINNGCICNDGYVGLFCQNKILSLDINNNKTIAIDFSPYQTLFFVIENLSESLQLKIEQFTKSGAAIKYNLFGYDSKSKLAVEETGYLNGTKTYLKIGSNIITKLYVNITCLAIQSSKAKFSLEYVGLNTEEIILIIIFVILLFVLMIWLIINKLILKESKSNDMETAEEEEKNNKTSEKDTLELLRDV